MVSLSQHNYGYQVSWGDLCSSFVTGASGYPYAQRHHELYAVSNKPYNHFMSIFLCVPVIGGIAAVVERVAYGLLGSNSLPWRDHPVAPGNALEKMIKNQKKALAEHYKADPSYFGTPYLKSMSLSAADLSKKETNELHLSPYFAEAQGPRPTMEDAHFYKEMEDGILTGVFDGHGGSEVSAYSSGQFQTLFPKALKRANGNVHSAFEMVIHQIHQKVANHAAWNDMGSTAVVCYFDKATHQIFTATLGDSEANIYRKTGWGGYASIPLSCIRDWLCKRDFKRLTDIHGLDAIKAHLKRIGGHAKYLRSHIDRGVNVARAIGDVSNTGIPGKPRVIHKPKITVNKLKSGDLLVLACDGLKDFLSEKEITFIACRSATTNLFQMIFGKPKQPRKIASQLVESALKRMNNNSNDNVTVVVIEVS